MLVINEKCWYHFIFVCSMPYLRKRIKGSHEGAGEIALGLITFATFAED